jgi:hypothetical protein
MMIRARQVKLTVPEERVIFEEGVLANRLVRLVTTGLVHGSMVVVIEMRAVTLR